ncbi:MAG: peptidoglycan-binding protein [Ruminococcus sp.]|nr:peptidoglycan-binding protein [Ruminococcus sp.]
MADNSIPVNRSAHSKNVREVQEYLRESGFTRDDGMPVIPDGIYGQHTKEAVANFQRSSGLPVTGEVDRVTWDRLYGYYEDLMINVRIQEGIKPLPDLNITLGIGDMGFSIMILQAMLNTVAGIYTNICTVPSEGVYDDSTAKAVKEIQAAAGIEPTGKTDIRTWNIIVRFFNAEVEREQRRQVV